MVPLRVISTAVVLITTFRCTDTHASDVKVFQDATLDFQSDSILGLPPEPSPAGKLSAFFGEAFLVDRRESPLRARLSLWPRRKANTRIYKNSGKVVYPRNQWLTQRYIEMVGLTFGVVEEGTVIPVFGCLYEVLGVDGNDPDYTRVRLMKADPDSELNARLDPYGYAIPNGGSLDITGQTDAKEIRVHYDATSGAFELTVSREYKGADLRYQYSTTSTGARKGDTIELRPDEAVFFRITDIVKPDAERGVSGWVEFRRLWPTIRPFGISETGRP